MKKALIIFAAVSFVFGCSSDDANSSTNSGNRPVTKQFNGQPLDNSGKPIPGIPDPKQANLSNAKPGATPTPGIPEANKADITNQKGATPTPGIPDEATRKRMIEQLKKNPNGVNTAPATAPGVKPNRTKTTPQGPLSRPRKAQQ